MRTFNPLMRPFHPGLAALSLAALALSAPLAARAQGTDRVAHQFVNDPFYLSTTTAPGALLTTAHFAPLGTTWALLPDAAGNGLTFSGTGTLYNAGAGLADYIPSAAPLTADYLVEADLVVKTAATTPGIGLRATADGQNRYVAVYNPGTGRVELSKVVAGTSALLGSSAQAITPGQSYHLQIAAVGPALTVLWAGSPVIQATDGSLTAAGSPEVQVTGASSDTTGIQVDNFQAGSPGLLGQPIQQDSLRAYSGPGYVAPIPADAALPNLAGWNTRTVRQGVDGAGALPLAGLTFPAAAAPSVSTQVTPTQIVIRFSGSAGAFSGDPSCVFNGVHIYQTGPNPRTITGVQVDAATTTPGWYAGFNSVGLGTLPAKVSFDAGGVYVNLGESDLGLAAGSSITLDVFSK